MFGDESYRKKTSRTFLYDLKRVRYSAAFCSIASYFIQKNSFLKNLLKMTKNAYFWSFFRLKIIFNLRLIKFLTMRLMLSSAIFSPL